MNFGKELPMHKKAVWAERHDPYTHASWVHYGPQPLNLAAKLFWLLYVVAIFTVILWVGIASADMLPPPGPTWQQMESIRMNQEVMIQQQDQAERRRQQEHRQPIYVRQPPDYGAILRKGLREYEENQK